MEGVVKINFDGVACSRSSTGGNGIIIKDHFRAILVAFHATVKDIVDPMTVETLATIKRLSLTKELGYTHIDLEEDALEVVNLLNSDKPDSSLMGNIFDEARAMKSKFNKCTITHVRREANLAAYAMAKRAMRSQDAHLWLDSFPSDVSICLVDCNHVI
ncbi:hypothetical protein PTKIN_Ptkin08bG0026400 [Pterospermum kingtungense]